MNLHIENCNLQDDAWSFWKGDWMVCCFLALDVLHLGGHTHFYDQVAYKSM